MSNAGTFPAAPKRLTMLAAESSRSRLEPIAGDVVSTRDTADFRDLAFTDVVLHDHDNELDCLRNATAFDRDIGLLDALFEADEAARDALGVNRGQTTFVPGVPCFEQHMRFRAAHLADTNAIGRESEYAS